MPAVLLVGLLLGGAILYLLFRTVPIRPVVWNPPEAPGYEGPFELNHTLGTSKLLPTSGQGPEDIIFDSQGRLYTGLEDGRLVRMLPDGSGQETVAQTGGRPLGLAVDSQDHLLVADAYRGLLRVSPSGDITTLVDHFEGRALVFTNHLDVAADGSIYFTETSDRYTFADFKSEFLESRPNGRLLVYDPNTAETRLVLDGLYFANGVAISPDQSYLLVCEGSRYRLRRLWLAGPRAGEWEIFIDNLPGFPDNLHGNGRGLYWLALVSPRLTIVDGLADKPFIRKIIYRLPEAIKPDPGRHGLVFALNGQGQVVHNLQDPDGTIVETSCAVEHDGWLYVGGLKRQAIARLPTPVA